MLVLSRKSEQSVVIGGSGQFEQLVKITVVNICGGSVRLGFEANNEVLIHRAEVWDRLGLDGRTEQNMA